MTNELRMAVRCHDSHQRPALKRKCSKCIMQQQQNSGLDITNASRSLSNYHLDPYVPDLGPSDMYHQSYHHAPHSHSSHHHQSSHHLHHGTGGDNVPSSNEMFRKLGNKSPNYHQEARRTPGGTKPWSTSGGNSAVTSRNQQISSVTNHHPAEIHHQFTLYHEESPPTPPPPPGSHQCGFQDCEVVDCDPQQRPSGVAGPSGSNTVNTNNPNSLRNRIGSVNHLNHHIPNGPVIINQENDSQLDNEEEDDVVGEPIDEVDMIENDNGFRRQAQHQQILPIPPPPPTLSQTSIMSHQMEQSAQSTGQSSTIQSKILLNTVSTGTAPAGSNRLNGPTIISLNNIGLHQDDYC